MSCWISSHCKVVRISKRTTNMGKAEALLFRKGLRILKSYQSSGIPFTGIHGTSYVNWGLDGAGSLHGWFRQQGSALNNLQIGTACLGLAEEQLKILQNTEDDVRQGMQEWEDARMEVIRYHHVQNATKQCIYGCQVGMNTISRQIKEISDPLGLEQKSMTVTDLLAAASRHISPLLDQATVNSDRERLETFVRKIYVDMKYKYEPFEWLYEGLSPIAMSHVLHTRKGTPAALALCLSALGERIGLMLLPMPNILMDQIDLTNNEVYKSFLDSLPSETALRLKSKTQSVIPEPTTWFLRLDNGTIQAEDTALFINCKKGIVMDKNDMMKVNPYLANMTLSEWRQQSTLRTWGGLIALAVQAHQRRGESDLVAHWIYMKLALDPLATEWETAISSPAF